MASRMRNALETISLVAPLGPGEISPVVKIGDNYHLFQLAERDGGGVAPYETIRETVRERYLQEGGQEIFRGWIEQLKEEAYIERRP